MKSYGSETKNAVFQSNEKNLINSQPWQDALLSLQLKIKNKQLTIKRWSRKDEGKTKGKWTNYLPHNWAINGMRAGHELLEGKRSIADAEQAAIE